jgi:hypothetical protein
MPESFVKIPVWQHRLHQFFVRFRTELSSESVFLGRFYLLLRDVTE